MKKITLLVVIFFLVFCGHGFGSNGATTETAGKDGVNPPRDYQAYLGIWVSGRNADSEEAVHKKGGHILEIIEIKNNYIRGTYCSIQRPPASRVAYFEFAGPLINETLLFTYDDGFFNEGEGRLTLRDDEIEVTLKRLKTSDSNRSGWMARGGVFTRPPN